MTSKLPVTPEIVRQAFLDKGLKPTQGSFGVHYWEDDATIVPNGHGYCCAIGALMCGHTNRFGSLFEQVMAVYDIPDSDAFALGFDGINGDHYKDRQYSDATRRCYELGRACWEAVKDLVP